MKDTDHFKDEDSQDEVTGACFEDPPLTIDHLSKDEMIEMIEPSTFFLTRMETLEVIRMVDLVVLSLNTF